MATLIVRNLDDDIKARLSLRAAKHGRSTEAEVRSILKQATTEQTWLSEWFDLRPSFSGDELTLPERTYPREITFDIDG